MSADIHQKNVFPFRDLIKNKKIFSLLLAFFVILLIESLSFLSFGFSSRFVMAFLIILLLAFGWKVIWEGAKSILRLDFSDINLLMTVAILGAVYLGQIEEALIIVVLFSLGEALEDYGMTQSKKSLEALVQSAPKTAFLKEKDKELAVEEIEVGDIIAIKPGDTIPMDGDVIVGSSLVNEAMITGEPLPSQKLPNDRVYAGTSNLNGYMEVRVAKEAKDSTMGKIVNLTYQSIEKKSRSQRFIEIFAKYYTPTVIVVSVLIVVIPVFFLKQPFNIWFGQAITLLVISCPCALVISTPVAVFSAIGNAASRGVVIKGGRPLEELAKSKVIAFDKTRTLTEGLAEVSDIFSYNGFSRDDVLACAAGLEIFSEHPIAKSIVSKARSSGLNIHKFENFKAVAGKGVVGECLVCESAQHCLGNLQFICDERDKNAELYIQQKMKELEGQGKTAIVVSENKNIKGIIGVTDKLRPESKDVVDSVRALGVKLVMLTGDNMLPAQYVAKQLKIDDIRFSLLPEQKDAEIQKIVEADGHVIMVGDGINDAPALARSSVGIAIGAVGSDLAIENADIALMNDNLSLIPYLISLGRACAQKIKFNISAAISVKLFFIILAALGHSSIATAIFADVGMTLLVVLNGLSLFNFQKA